MDNNLGNLVDNNARLSNASDFVIDMHESNLSDSALNISMQSASGRRSSNLQQNLLTFISEARSQLGRQNSTPSPTVQQSQIESQNLLPLDVDSTVLINERSSGNGANMEPLQPRSWRMNLNNMLSFSSSPSTAAIRSFITHSGGFRYSYTPLNSGESTATANRRDILQTSNQDITTSNDGGRVVSRSNSYIPPRFEQSEGSADQRNPSRAANENESSLFSTTLLDRSTSQHQQNENENAQNADEAGNNDLWGADETNAMADIAVKFLSQLLRYLPYFVMLILKFVYDHLWGIFDIVLLHIILMKLNKSVRKQVAKLSQKDMKVLIWDWSIVAIVITYRLLLAWSTSDPLGLLISPPKENISIDLSSANHQHILTTDNPEKNGVINHLFNKFSISFQPFQLSTNTTNDTLTITKAISLGTLLYYVAVNDLVLKLITVLIKVTITMLPTKVIRHKSRARLLVVIEYVSQFYRSVVPIRQWIMFLILPYIGYEMIIGMLLSAFYVGSKMFEIFGRGKSLKKAVVHFVRNTDYEYKPTKAEIESAGSICPICHDNYNNPIALECGHIFCDDCVNTWFKREQTCPMCRSKQSEDKTWQDGSTSLFYQIF